MKKGVYYDLVKKVNAIDSNRQNLKEKVKKRHLTPANLIWPKNLIDLDAKLTESLKSMATKQQIENALNLGNKK